MANQGARACLGLNPTGRAQLLAIERGKERSEDDRWAPPIISNLTTEGSASSAVMMQGTARQADGTDVFSIKPHIGGWWRQSLEWATSPATRR